MPPAASTCWSCKLGLDTGTQSKFDIFSVIIIYKKYFRSKFAAFDELLGVEIGHAAGARLIHEDDGESVELFAESHFHDKDPNVEEVEVVRFAKFITDVVATRKLPNSAKVTKPNVIIKVIFYHSTCLFMAVFLPKILSSLNIYFAESLIVPIFHS